MASGISQTPSFVNTPIHNANAAEAGGLLSKSKDAKESSTAPKFGEVYKQIQTKYGEKPEKPREIKKTLGKDDFLKIMITQMKNQDPTSPFKAEQMATEIAQFTSVEQLHNVNQNLNKMAEKNRPLEQMAMISLIGKKVTVDRERFPHIEGQNDSLSFYLPKDAEEVKIAIINETGEVALEKDLGAQKAGEVLHTWDGIKTNTLPAKSGNYMLRVEAKDSSGKNIDTNPQAQTQVIGVSFESGEPVFLVGDGKRQEKITMRNIVKIESDFHAQPQQIQPQFLGPQQGMGQSPAAGKPQSAFTPVGGGQPGPSNFISFQKGVGSSNIDLNQVNPDMAKLFESYQKPEERGFPSGLSDPDQQKSKGGETQ